MDVGKEMSGSQHIARERSESAYIWDTDKDRNTERGGIGFTKTNMTRGTKKTLVIQFNGDSLDQGSRLASVLLSSSSSSKGGRGRERGEGGEKRRREAAAAVGRGTMKTMTASM